MSALAKKSIYGQVADRPYDDLSMHKGNIYSVVTTAVIRYLGLSATETKVLLFLIERTIRYQKEKEFMSNYEIKYGHFKKDGTLTSVGTGLSIKTLSLKLRKLEQKKYIVIDRTLSPNRITEVAKKGIFVSVSAIIGACVIAKLNASKKSKNGSESQSSGGVVISTRGDGNFDLHKDTHSNYIIKEQILSCENTQERSEIQSLQKPGKIKVKRKDKNQVQGKVKDGGCQTSAVLKPEIQENQDKPKVRGVYVAGLSIDSVAESGVLPLVRGPAPRPLGEPTGEPAPVLAIESTLAPTLALEPTPTAQFVFKRATEHVRAPGAAVVASRMSIEVTISEVAQASQKARDEKFAKAHNAINYAAVNDLWRKSMQKFYPKQTVRGCDGKLFGILSSYQKANAPSSLPRFFDFVVESWRNVSEDARKWFRNEKTGQYIAYDPNFKDFMTLYKVFLGRFAAYTLSENDQVTSPEARLAYLTSQEALRRDEHKKRAYAHSYEVDGLKAALEREKQGSRKTYLELSDLKSKIKHEPMSKVAADLKKAETTTEKQYFPSDEEFQASLDDSIGWDAPEWPEN